MKIGIIQCDVVPGDLAGNAAKLANFIRGAAADFWIAPLFALTGPVPECVLRNADFARTLICAESELARALENSPPLLYGTGGAPRLLQGGRAAVVDGEFPFKNMRVKVLETRGFALPRRECRADLLCCLAAAPFVGKKAEFDHLRNLAEGNNAPILFANLVGGYDAAIYAGSSCSFDGHGRMRQIAQAFEEAVLIFDTDAAFTPCAPPEWSRERAVLDALILGTRDFVRKCGCRQVVIGLSGGMDSALVAAIAVEALGAENVSGILMPSPFSSEHSVRDALELAKNLGIRTLELPIAELLESLEKTLAPAYSAFEALPGDLTLQNLQARARGVLLSAVSNRSGALVLNTGNKSEAAMGYFTLYGDSAGALAVIGDVYKTEVYKLAEEFNKRRGKMAIPAHIFEKPPSAELAPNQKDSDTLPPYAALDAALEKIIPGGGAAETDFGDFTRDRLLAMEFKRRQCPPALVVSEHPLAACRPPLGAKWGFDAARCGIRQAGLWPESHGAD